jgi:hypothetical protein
MLVSSLDQMESIVKKNKELMWDGWDVIHFYHSDKARTSKFGIRVNGKWCMHKRFPIESNGWNVPNKLVR